MTLSEVERDITNVVVQRFLSQDQATPRRELALKFKPRGTDAILRLVRLNVLRREPFEQFLPNAIAFHSPGHQRSRGKEKWDTYCWPSPKSKLCSSRRSSSIFTRRKSRYTQAAFRLAMSLSSPVTYDCN